MPPAVRIDRTDLALLTHLANDARISNRALAEAVGLAPSSCLERVRRLVQRGVIRGTSVDIDPAALGRGLQAMIAVRLRTHSRAAVDRFHKHVQSLDETMAVYHIGGTDDFLVHVAVPESAALRDVVLDKFTTRPEVVHVETSIIFDHHVSRTVKDASGA